MKVYLLLDGLTDDENPTTIADKLQSATDAWLEIEELELIQVNERPDKAEEWKIGLQLNCKHKTALKAPLEFLFKWAKKMEREFVIGFYDKETGNREDVCYFGYEEGRPDFDEVGLYLGINR